MSSETSRRSPTKSHRTQSTVILAVLTLAGAALGYRLWSSPAAGIDEVAGDSAITADQAVAKPLEAVATNYTAPLRTDAVCQQEALAAQQLDPSRDGWDTEVLAERAKQQLTQLASLLSRPEQIHELESQLSPEIEVNELRPAKLETSLDRGRANHAIVVRRARDEHSASTRRGVSVLQAEMAKLAEPFTDLADLHVHVKVIRVDASADEVTTVAYYHVDAHDDEQTIQQRATWSCRWQIQDSGQLTLQALTSSDFEEVVTGSQWLVDCTKAVLGGNEAFQKQLLYGLNHWLRRVERVHGMHVYARYGLAVGDVSGDGLDDVYVCQPGGLPNRLFVQQQDGTAIDFSKQAGVDWLDHTSAALLLDLDNDGDQDLVAATVVGLLVMENDGQARFKLRSTLATVDTDPQSFAAADYDNDGDLDLYLCMEFARQFRLQYETRSDFVYHDANDGAANILFRNDIAGGTWKFTDVTKEVGLDVDNRRHSLACGWEDFDNDGDQDLYVANDYGRNCLYENLGGKFHNIAEARKAVDSASGMSVNWGDYDHDGLMDLYIANMFSSAGNRVTQQRQFKANADPSLRDVYLRFAKGNTLLRNAGQQPFEDTGEGAGVEMGRWAWSSVFADLNNDTWDDLLVANGYITTDDTGDL